MIGLSKNAAPRPIGVQKPTTAADGGAAGDWGVLSKTANYTVVAADYTSKGLFLRAARSATITLEALASLTTGSRTVVRRTDDGSSNGTIKIQPATGESLNGVANGFVELTNDQQSVLLIKDSGGYWEIAP